MNKLADCRLIALPKISEARGNLTFIESGRHVPFDCKRIYYTYDVPGGSDRGAHAHRQLHQCLIAVSGSFDVVLDDGSEKKRFHLNRPDTGLYVCPMVWRELDGFSSGSVCLVLASEFYDADDYYREYDVFLKDVKANGKKLKGWKAERLRPETLKSWKLKRWAGGRRGDRGQMLRADDK
jgi:hypothetical protein